MKKLAPAVAVVGLGVVLVWAVTQARRGAADDALGVDGALEQLRAELDLAPRPAGRSDADRLSDALAWVRANRPAGWPFAELEARVLADYEARARAEARSVAWALAMARQEVEWVRAMDTDLDGRVSEEEIGALGGFSRGFLDPTSHPYLVAMLDGDGDGRIDGPFLDGLSSVEAEQAGLLERARLDLWDTDGDGTLSEAERGAGAAEARLHQVVFTDGHIEYTDTPAPDAVATQESVLARLAEEFGAAAAQMTRDRLGVAADYQLAGGLARQLALIEPGAGQVSEAPPFPELTLYDPDGDGQLDEQQFAAFEAARLGWEAALRDWQAAEGARRMARQFETLAVAGDADGDGRMTEGEWHDLIATRLAERDRRLVLRSYDADGSGRIELGEVESFLGWFRAGSVRADANFDGLVDASDLEALIGHLRAPDR
jgi:Ca2+-binding EF-hand superfamily protein